LEAEGTVEIKFKWKDQVKAMHRLDPELRDILRLMNNPELPDSEKKQLEKKKAAREKLLASIYHQVAVHFADLHDTAERMHEKGVIQVS
jgi:hypothetical protein